MGMGHYGLIGWGIYGFKWVGYLWLNPLPTDDAFWRRQILAACYQLAQCILKIGSALAERVGQGEVGGFTALPDSAWWRLQLPVEKTCSMTGAPFVCFLAGTPFLAI